MSNDEFNKMRDQLFELSAKQAEAEARGDQAEADRIKRLRKAKDAEMRGKVK